jgi:hypothetical protein
MKSKWQFRIVFLVFFIATGGQTNAEENTMIEKMVLNNSSFAVGLYSHLKQIDGNLGSLQPPEANRRQPIFFAV